MSKRRGVIQKTFLGMQRVAQRPEWTISKHLPKEIGVRCNTWTFPINTFGCGDEQIKKKTEEMNFSLDAWKRATDIADKVLNILLVEVMKEASKIKGLQIKKYIKQGSSREGLKVGNPDEFDVLLLFELNDIQFKVEHVNSDDREHPELCRLVLSHDPTYSHAELCRRHVFTQDVDQKWCLSSANLHEKVFISIIDACNSRIKLQVNDTQTIDKFEIDLKTRKNAPSVNICIKMSIKDDTYDYMEQLSRIQQSLVQLEAAVTLEINIDVVPGLLIAEDTIPDPSQMGQEMKCPRYAVFKWFQDSHPLAHQYSSNSTLLWRLCSSGYEKHVLDVARGSTEQCYILTALRIVKLHFQKKDELYGDNKPQIVTVLRSYHLKQIALYCILYLTVMNKAILTGVKDALAYLLDFLKTALEKRKLPHFFVANPNLIYMFPHYDLDQSTLKYNLFMNKAEDALNQACKSMSLMLEQFNKICSDSSTASPEFSEAFGKYIDAGQYF